MRSSLESASCAVRGLAGTRSIPPCRQLPRSPLSAFVLFAVIGFARVAISAATVTTSIESQQLAGQISDARTEGSDLEVTQSMLSNPTRIKAEAAALDMGAAADVENIDLSGDVVVTDEAGNLSLSGSVAAVS